MTGFMIDFQKYGTGFHILYKSIDERSNIWPAEKDTKTWLIIAVMHTTEAVVKFKSEKNSDLNGIRTRDPCYTGAVLYQLSYQANWELATSWIRNIPVNGEEYKWIHER